jgi:3-keto-5-aminohexanoate cleavage enzyme
MKSQSDTRALIINFTPTGSIPTKQMTPHVPVSVSEIVEDVHRAHELGITMVHLHARDSRTGHPTFKAEVYQAVIEGIRSFAPDLIICVSLTGRDFNEFEKRSEVLQLNGKSKPDMGSLTLSSLNFNHQASINTPDMIKSLAQVMFERGILPELEAFDSGMINYAKYLERKGLLEPPHYFNLIVGNIACAQADLLHMGVMINDLPSQSLWSLGGVGDTQFQVNAIALVSGGGVRVGLEDTIWYDQNRTRLATNPDLLQRIHDLAEATHRPVMSPAILRKHLNLEAGYGRYGRIRTNRGRVDA